MNVPAGVCLEGGYNTSDMTTRNPDLYVSKITSTAEATIIYEDAATQNDTKLDGFTITNTRAYETNSHTIVIRNGASPTISNNIIYNDGFRIEFSGTNMPATAGIFNSNGSPLIEYNEIHGGSGNSLVDDNAPGSAGIYCQSGNVKVQYNSLIHGGNGTSLGSDGSVGIWAANLIQFNEIINGGSGVSNSYYGSVAIRNGTSILNNIEINGGNGSISVYDSSASGSAGIVDAVNVSGNILINGGSGSGAGQYGSIAIVGTTNISNNIEINGGSGTTDGAQGRYHPTGVGSCAIRHVYFISNNSFITGGTGVVSSSRMGIGSVGIYLDTTMTVQSNVIDGGGGTAQEHGSIGVYIPIPNRFDQTKIIKNNLIIAVMGNAYFGTGLDNCSIFVNTKYDVVANGLIISNNTLIAGSISSNNSLNIALPGINNVQIGNNILILTGSGNKKSIQIYDVIGTFDLINNLFINNTSEIYYNRVNYQLVTEVNTLNNLDPYYFNNIVTSQTINDLFVDPANDDYHLMAGSDAIDVGFTTNGSFWGAVVDDLDGEDRPKGAAYDIGYDEY